MSSDMSVPGILLRAADAINRLGLARNTRQDESGAFCAHGAIAFAVYANPWAGNHNDDSLEFRAYTDAWLAVRDHLVASGVLAGYVSCGLASWSNDSSKSEVVEGLVKAADRCANRMRDVDEEKRS